MEENQEQNTPAQEEQENAEEVQHEKTGEVCPKCGGTGLESNDKLCEPCEGSGTV